ncbi:MAG: hypothetical protein RIS70_171 [Planctomycetota bacterium]|jgi:hypothetical protein
MTPIRIAMWSGPRNISTAMMRSWESRTDTFVCDEPLYAHYLKVTGLPHPGAAEVIAHHETEWRNVVRWLCGPIPGGKTVFYQKQMAHHLLPEIEEDWLDHVTNCFLIRDPASMVVSLSEFIPSPILTDTGLPQQVRIFKRVLERTGKTPPVIDARDVLLDPRKMMTRLCESLGLEFQEQMLKWRPGPRETDGVWAKHWYAKVYQTTEFGTYQPPAEATPTAFQPLVDQCRPLYEYLHQHRLS